jgi:iduronate 2-sulfatase
MRCGWILGLVLLAGCHSPSSEGVSEGVSEGASEGAGRKNLLFLMFDDLRADLSVYGSECVSECGSENRATLTPHMDRLAARGVVFDHAYCQVAVCAPSRHSLLSGKRPDSLGAYDFEPLDPARGVLLLPQRLARAGYRTAGFGKLLHREDNKLLRAQNWNVEQVEECSTGTATNHERLRR